MPSAKDKPVDPKLRGKVIEELRSHRSRDATAKGLKAAWKAAKLAKECETGGSDPENEPGSKSKPTKGPRVKKPLVTKAKDRKMASKNDENGDESSDDDELSDSSSEDASDATEDEDEEEPKVIETKQPPKKKVVKKGIARPLSVKKKPAMGERRSARLQILEGFSESSSGSSDSMPSPEKRKTAEVEHKGNALVKRVKGKK